MQKGSNFEEQAGRSVTWGWDICRNPTPWAGALRQQHLLGLHKCASKWGYASPIPVGYGPTCAAATEGRLLVAPPVQQPLHHALQGDRDAAPARAQRPGTNI